MAIQPPPAPALMQQATPPTTPKKGGCFGRGCDFVCVRAQAAVTAPAALMLINQPVDVDQRPGLPGEALNKGNTVHTGAGGRAAIQFPGGPFLGRSPARTVTA